MHLIDHRYGHVRMLEAHERADRARHARARRGRPADRARSVAAQLLLRVARRLEPHARGSPAARVRHP